MKYTEDRKVRMKSDVEMGTKEDAFNIHVTTSIKLPDTDNEHTRKIVEIMRTAHKDIDDINQTSLPLEGEK